jgi:lecithin-cholesterol acyltransferase
MNGMVVSTGIAVVLLSTLLCGSGTTAAAQDVETAAAKRTPVVVFPAFHFTKLVVTVDHQTTAPGCPASGTFEDWFLNDIPSNFSQICQDKLLTLVYDDDSHQPMHRRFSEQPGVTVRIKDFGRTESAPFYEDLYVALEGTGYVRNKSIRVAGYDSRLTPDQDGFLPRTIALIEETYRQNGNTPVHLVGHSNGPLYAQYLLTHTSRKWKNKHLHGFTPFAGNWPGQGLFYGALFTGLNIVDFGFPTDPVNAASSAAMYESHPSSYMSAADPAIFGDQEVVVQTRHPRRTYTPEDNLDLFDDADLDIAEEVAPFYTGFVKFAEPAFFPDVDVYAEKGSGFPTIVGVKLRNLGVGQVFDVANPDLRIERDGDFNQEDLTNDSIQVWEEMPCFRFSLTDNPGVDHFALVSDPDVLARLLTNLRRPKSVCH